MDNSPWIILSRFLNLLCHLDYQWRLQEFSPGCSYFTLKKFHVISVYFGCFGKHRLKFKIWSAWSLCLKKKKKKNLKTKTNLHSVHQKILKEKKKMNKGTCTINYKFIWNINKIINYCCLVVSLICLSFINYNLLYYYFINYKIINYYLA